MLSHEVRRPPEAALEIRKRSLVGSRLWSLNNEPRHFGKAFFPGAFPFFMSVAVISRYPFLRTNPERGIMHYEKRSDGRSWLFFERIAQRVRRRLAIVRLDPQTREHVVERLDATDAELEVVRERARAIRMPEESRAGAMRISLVCEGETEAAYLGALSSALGIRDRVDITVSPVKDPGAVFETEAREQLWKRAIGEPVPDEVWLVFDRDSHQGFIKALEFAGKIPFMRTAFTSPCIEHWFLLHLADFDGGLPAVRRIPVGVREEETRLENGMIDCVSHSYFLELSSPEACLMKLRELLPGYRKNSKAVFDKIAPGMKLAFERARSLPPLETGDATQMPALIERLFEMAGMTTAQGFAAFAGKEEEKEEARNEEDGRTDETERATSEADGDSLLRRSAGAVARAARCLLENQAESGGIPSEWKPSEEDVERLRLFLSEGLDEGKLKAAQAQRLRENPEAALTHLMQSLHGFAAGGLTISLPKTKARMVAELGCLEILMKGA